MIQKLCLNVHKLLIPSDIWIDNFAHEQNVLCVAFRDDDHKWTIELQDRNVAEGKKCYADACGSCSSRSGLIDIQGGLVHNLRRDGGKVS